MFLDRVSVTELNYIIVKVYSHATLRCGVCLMANQNNIFVVDYYYTGYYVMEFTTLHAHLLRIFFKVTNYFDKSIINHGYREILYMNEIEIIQCWATLNILL